MGENNYIWIVDVVLLLIFLIVFLAGLKKGIVQSLFKVGGQILGFLVAITCCNSFSKWLAGFDFTADLSAYFSETLFSDPMYSIPASSATSADVVTNSFLPNILLKFLLGSIESVGDVTLSVYLGYAVTNLFYHVVSFVFLYSIVLLAAFVLGKLFSSLIQVSVIVKFWDRLLGGVFYVLSALLNVYILCMILLLFGDPLSEWISQTVVLNFLYQNNPLSYLSFAAFESWIDSVIRLLPSPTDSASCF